MFLEWPDPGAHFWSSGSDPSPRPHHRQYGSGHRAGAAGGVAAALQPRGGDFVFGGAGSGHGLKGYTGVSFLESTFCFPFLGGGGWFGGKLEDPSVWRVALV